jgi:hypothetical protein
MLILFGFKIIITNVMFDYLAGTPVRVFFDLLTLMFLFYRYRFWYRYRQKFMVSDWYRIETKKAGIAHH